MQQELFQGCEQSLIAYDRYHLTLIMNEWMKRFYFSLIGKPYEGEMLEAEEPDEPIIITAKETQ